jgi:hypothetical protein
MRLIIWVVYVAIYYILSLIVGLPFSDFLAILFGITLIILLMGFNLWGIRSICYISIIITTFFSEREVSENDSILAALIFFGITGWGFLGSIIEFFQITPSKRKLIKLFK